MLHGVQPLQQGTEPTNPHWRVGFKGLLLGRAAATTDKQGLATSLPESGTRQSKNKRSWQRKIVFFGGCGGYLPLILA